METEYDGVKITYDEKANLWRFTLRGRDRSAESLANAKQAIDKPVPEEKAKPFKRIPAIKVESYVPNFYFGEITSIAETPRYSNRVEVWFTRPDGRRKEDLTNFVADTPENRAVIGEAEKLLKEANDLREKAQNLASFLPKLEISVPD